MREFKNKIDYFEVIPIKKLHLCPRMVELCLFLDWIQNN